MIDHTSNTAHPINSPTTNQDYPWRYFSLQHFLYSIQVRFNTKTRSVEMKTSSHTLDTGALQKGADFVSAFMMGFEVQDAVALLRLDDLYLESFQVTDVKLLQGDHLSRAIGRVAGVDGKTRFAIENATRTRIVIADQRIHLLGSFANLRVARNAICDLILGAPPGKVYNNMRSVAKRMSERYWRGGGSMSEPRKKENHSPQLRVLVKNLLLHDSL